MPAAILTGISPPSNTLNVGLSARERGRIVSDEPATRPDSQRPGAIRLHLNRTRVPAALTYCN